MSSLYENEETKYKVLEYLGRSLTEEDMNLLLETEHHIESILNRISTASNYSMEELVEYVQTVRELGI